LTIAIDGPLCVCQPVKPFGAIVALTTWTSSGDFAFSESRMLLSSIRSDGAEPRAWNGPGVTP
jgi:hypothetical protein